MHTPNAVDIAFVNNMPAAAFAETERQFRVLLGAGPALGAGTALGAGPALGAGTALGAPAVSLRLYAPRERLAGRELDDAVTSAYRPVEELFSTSPDGAVITGCEPAGGDLRGEPLWPLYERIFEWAPGATRSLWLACLAAHAALAHYDGLWRRPLPCKYSAVLSQAVDWDHPLTAGLPVRVAIPHSRANEVPTAALRSAGYRLAIASAETGWTVATAERAGCLLVAVQGHPEYAADTLLREYRRDVRRFLAKERDLYPPLPAGYLDRAAEERFTAFRRRAERHQTERHQTEHRQAEHRGPGEAADGSQASSRPVGDPELIEQFPFAEEAARLRASWAPVAARLGRNWLAGLAGTAPGARSQLEANPRDAGTPVPASARR